MRVKFNYSMVRVLFNNHLVDYPCPTILNYFWSFGSLAGFCLVTQIITGLSLSMHYIPHGDYAFNSVEHIMRDVNYGWLIRYTHSNGSSMFFIVIYIHMAKAVYYSSFAYPRQLVWYSGLIIFILLMAIAFTGYVLPWGQMSFWGATVISNLFTAIPYIGDSITKVLWGGFSVADPTLNRFYTFHFLLPFLLVFVVILHIALLHQVGSNNPLGIDTDDDLMSFYPYYVYKDLFALTVFILIFGIIVFFFPNKLGHPDNYIPANPMITPAHIVPEWYFLPFYAMLRAVPSKLGGVTLMGSSIGILFFLPKLYKPIWLGPRFKPLYMIFFWLFICSVIWLGYIGGEPANDLNIWHSQCFTVAYFSHFIIFLPFCSWFEHMVYDSMTEDYKEQLLKDKEKK